MTDHSRTIDDRLENAPTESPYLSDLTDREIQGEIDRLEHLLRCDLPFGEEQERGIRGNIEILKAHPNYRKPE